MDEELLNDPELIAEVVGEMVELLEEASTLLRGGGNVDLNKLFRSFHTVKGSASMIQLTLIANLAHGLENGLSKARDGVLVFSDARRELVLEGVDILSELVAADAEEGNVSADNLKFIQRVYRAFELDADSVVDHIADLVKASRKRAKEPAATETKARKESVRVDLDALDGMMGAVGDLLMVDRTLRHIALRDNSPELVALSQQYGVMLHRLYEQLLDVRRVPFESISGRLERIVRDAARKEGKKVSLKVTGGSAPLDRSVIRVLNEVLVHLLRNAVAHGVEDPEERLESGKYPTSIIRVEVEEAEDTVEIAIRDDGRGVDPAQVLKKAIKVGLLDEETAKTWTTQRIQMLIFEAGFSTKEVVDDVSGRGVGMDVVINNIRSAGGTVRLRSVVGKGTEVMLRLPKAALPVLDGLIVELGGLNYLLSLDTVRWIGKTKGADITLSSGQTLVRVEGRTLALVNRRPVHDAGLIVALEHGDEWCALAVDAVLGRERVLRKTIDAWVRPPSYVGDCFLLGDGAVGYVLEVHELMHAELWRRTA